MSEMIDRVAKALRVGRGCDAGEVPCPFCLWGPDQLTPEWDETGCIWLARAAFEAMRKPTPEIWTALAHAIGNDLGTAECWMTAIDAALDKPSQ